VVGPRKAVDAAMLAALVGIDRAIEADVRRCVVSDDRLRLFEDGFGLQCWRLFLSVPAIVEGLGILLLELARGVRQGAAPARLVAEFGPVGVERPGLPFFLWGMPDLR